MNKINKNNNKLRNIFMLGVLPSLTLITVMSAVISSNSNIINNKDNNMVVKGDPISYNLSFNPYGLLDSEVSSTEKSFVTSRVITYPLTFKYMNAYSYENDIAKINKDGYIKNFTEIKGINSIRYNGTGSLRLELGYSTSYMEVTNLIINSNEEYVLSNSYNYFSISNTDSSPVEVSSLSIKYSCVAGSHSESFTEGLRFNYLDDSDSLSAVLTSDIKSNPTTLIIPDIYLGKRVTNITFSGTYTLSKVTTLNIGRYVSNIAMGTFDYTKAITTINVDSNNASLTSVGNVIYSKDMTTLVFAPNNVFLNGLIVPDSVTTIKSRAFSNSGTNVFTGYVVIPTSVTTIESNGFYKVGTPLFTYHASKPVGWNSDFTNNKNQEISYYGTWHIENDVPVKNS